MPKKPAVVERSEPAHTRERRAPDRSPAGAKPPTETQRRILAAALELFAERGYAATSTAAIADRAGVAEKTIFANFSTKGRLFEEILNPAALEMLVPEAIGGVQRTLSMRWGTTAALLDAFMHNRLEFVRKHPAKLKLLAQALLLHPERTEVFVRAFRAHLESRIEGVLDGLEQAGEIRALPHRSLARIVISMTSGYMLMRFVLRPDAEWDDEAELATMIDILVNGLRPRA